MCFMLLYLNRFWYKILYPNIIFYFFNNKQVKKIQFLILKFNLKVQSDSATAIVTPL